MKLYDGGRAPNPRRVRIFLAEKGITVPTEQVELGQLQQRSDAYTAINPMQRVPALVLDDGTVIDNPKFYGDPDGLQHLAAETDLSDLDYGSDPPTRFSG